MATEQGSARITDTLVRRICIEFIEMPGLCLTLEQAQRLWNLDEQTCGEAMQLLVDIKFISKVVRDASGSPPGKAIAFRRPRTVTAFSPNREDAA